MQKDVEDIRHGITDSLLQVLTMQVCRIFRSRILGELWRPLHLRRTSVGVPTGRRDWKLTRFFRRCTAMVAHRSAQDISGEDTGIKNTIRPVTSGSTYRDCSTEFGISDSDAKRQYMHHQ